jgi:hypothetical protein
LERDFHDIARFERNSSSEAKCACAKEMDVHVAGLTMRGIFEVVVLDVRE